MNTDFLTKYGYDISAEARARNSSVRVVVGMSGGVDSSVCAAVLKAQGYETIGIFMRNWEEIDEHGRCSAEEDYADVISVCERLDIPYYSLNFSEDYKNQVFKDFLREYEKGFTPNPDILCNREIKFKVFYEHAKSLGADFLATGHYCQIEFGQNDGKPLLVKGKDNNKDQSYFLYAIEGSVLRDVIFPIGHLEKPQVREIAKKFNLSTRNKKDSTGICFIGERDFKGFLTQYIKEAQGNFVNYDTQKIMGPHDGHCFYTIGQRKGLGLGGPGGPWFVVDKDSENNIVYVGEGEDHPALYSSTLKARELNWLKKPNFPMKCKAKIRYRQKDQACQVDIDKDGSLTVVFDKAQRAITLRQSVVFYDDEICLGGGVIYSRGPSQAETLQGLP